MAQMLTRECWKEVNRADPCPVCNHASWCRRSPDGDVVACRRQERGAYKVKTYRDSSHAYIHYLGNGLPPGNSRPRNLTGPSQQSSNRVQTSPAEEPSCASAEIRHRAYGLLLQHLELSDKHMNALRRRGLTDDDIEAGQYRSLPEDTGAVATQLLARLSAETFQMIPGFLCHGETSRIAGPAGLLVPVRNCDGRIIAIKVRRDEARDGAQKYM